MVNRILTPDIIAQEGLMLLENELVIANKVHTDYSDEFSAVGETISIDRPYAFAGQDDNLDVSGYNEDLQGGKTTISMNKTKTVKFKLTAKEKTLSLDRVSEKIIKPAIVVLKDRIESELAKLYPEFYMFDGTPGTSPSTFKALAGLGAMMTDNAVPADARFALHSPMAAVDLADGLKSVFVQDKVKTALERGTIGRYANFENFEFVHAPTHIVGDHGGTPLVNGSAQGVTYATSADTGTSTLVTDGWTVSKTNLLRKGDIITIAGVFEVNPVSLESTGRLRTFTMVSNANSDSAGNATLTIAPAIIPASATIANGKAFATVTAAPADNAAITVKTGAANASHRQSLLLHPNALALVTRPLDIASGAGVKTSTKTGNKVTISVTEWVDGNTLDHNFRFDILFGVKALDRRLGARLTN